jgi:hypothetical protein
VYNDIRDKIYNLDKSPYDKTIFIDADTLVLGDITGIFKLLDRVDLAAPHAQSRPVVEIKDVPDAFTELSTAVVGYENNSRILDLFNQWKSYHKQQMEHGRPKKSITIPYADTLEEASSFGRKHGQPPFREALYHSDIKYHVLPTEYLFRSSSFAYNNVKILHYGSRERGEKVARIINKDIEKRFLINWKGKLYREKNGTERISYPFLESLVSNEYIHRILKYLGIYGTVRKLYHRFSDYFHLQIGQ